MRNAVLCGPTSGGEKPAYGGGHARTDEYKNEKRPVDLVFPQVEMVAHAEDLGMTFYTGHMFPPQYRGAIFSAQHGSWKRTVPVGARVRVTILKEDGTVGKSEPFAEGRLGQNGEYLGGPVDVAQLKDGSLLVSEDFAGALYCIWYDGKWRRPPDRAKRRRAFGRGAALWSL